MKHLLFCAGQRLFGELQHTACENGSKPGAGTEDGLSCLLAPPFPRPAASSDRIVDKRPGICYVVADGKCGCTVGGISRFAARSSQRGRLEGITPTGGRLRLGYRSRGTLRGEFPYVAFPPAVCPRRARKETQRRRPEHPQRSPPTSRAPITHAANRGRLGRQPLGAAAPPARSVLPSVAGLCKELHDV